MQLLDSKSLLAKLMATENITIQQKNVSTAAFDVKNRVLVVPTLDKNISGNLYDLFMGHEVGHALYTPLEGVTKAKELKLNRSVLNVVEDVRIERKIKFKYPGLRNSFVKGYKELSDRDFFQIKGIDCNNLNFIDKVNVHSKIGAILGIKFDSEERALLNEIESTETYDDVIEVSKKIVDYMKKKQEEQKVQAAESEEDDEEESGDNYADFDEWDESESDDQEEGNEQFGLSEESDEQESGEESGQQHPTEGGCGTDTLEEKTIRSFTDDAYKQNENKLFDDENTEYLYLNVPKIDLDKAIMDYKALWTKYKHWDTESYRVDFEKLTKMRKDTNKVTSYLVKEFEMRKNADQLKRASTAKTGELNMNKIYSYKFNDDIFKKITVVPGGKSHGLVLFLDWSGSMNDHLENTVKQLLSLVMFCKKVNIPYEVYAFRQAEVNDDEGGYKGEYKENDICTNPFRLINLLSSRMSATEFSYAASALVWMSGHAYWVPHWLSLGGTPLNEAIISAMDIIPQFQKKYKLQIVNTVFLTDGDGHSLRSYYSKDNDGNNCFRNMGAHSATTKRIIFTDKVTKKQETLENNWNTTSQTSALVKLLKYRTNCNVLGFYILSGREFSRACYKFYPAGVDTTSLKTAFRKDKFSIVKNAGFDEYYLLRSEALDTEDDVEFKVKENATTRGLVSAFSKYNSNRVSSRVVLNRFIGMIS